MYEVVGLVFDYRCLCPKFCIVLDRLDDLGEFYKILSLGLVNY